MNDPLTMHKQYLATFDGPAGKAVLEDILRYGGLMSSTFSTDPLRAAYNAGKRDLALYIHGRLQEPKERNK